MTERSFYNLSSPHLTFSPHTKKEKVSVSKEMTEEVYQMSQIHIEGNIIPMEWFKKVCFENGRPDMNAIVILSDIVYWYRPTVVRDEYSGQVKGYRKKFKEDYLRRSYQDFETLYGLTKRQTRECLKRLEDLGLIERIFRDVDTSIGSQRNVMYLRLIPQKVAEFSAMSLRSAVDVTTGYGDGCEGRGVVTSTSPRGDTGVTIIYRNGDYLGDYSSSSSEVSENLSEGVSLPSEQAEKNEEEEEEGNQVLGGKEAQECFSQGILKTPSAPLSDSLPSGPKASGTSSELSSSVMDQAVEVWNRSVQGDRPLIRLTTAMRSRFKALLEALFQSDVQQWTGFCEEIASNKFLMGEGTKGWRVTFDWILDESHATDVLNGKYWYKTSPSADTSFKPTLSQKLDQEIFLQNLELRCKEQSSDPRWHSICRELVTSIGASKFRSWFWDVSSVRYEKEALRIFVESRFKKDYISQHFLEDLKSAALDSSTRLESVVIECLKDKGDYDA